MLEKTIVMEPGFLSPALLYGQPVFERLALKKKSKGGCLGTAL